MFVGVGGGDKWLFYGLGFTVKILKVRFTFRDEEFCIQLCRHSWLFGKGHNKIFNNYPAVVAWWSLCYVGSNPFKYGVFIVQ